MTTADVMESLQAKDADEIAHLIARAFIDLEITRWLVPDDPEERRRCLSGQFALHVRHALRGNHGRVRGIRRDGDLVAVAVWVTQPGCVPVPAAARYNRELRRITGTHYPRFRALDDAFATHTPRLRHDHLAFLAAIPQNQGLGTRLLTDYLTRIDERPGNRPMIYLEASSPAAARLYRAHGFLPDPPVEIPGSGGLTFRPMRRFPTLRAADEATEDTSRITDTRVAGTRPGDTPTPPQQPNAAVPQPLHRHSTQDRLMPPSTTPPADDTRPPRHHDDPTVFGDATAAGEQR